MVLAEWHAQKYEIDANKLLKKLNYTSHLCKTLSVDKNIEIVVVHHVQNISLQVLLTIAKNGFEIHFAVHVLVFRCPFSVVQQVVRCPRPGCSRIPILVKGMLKK